MTIINWIIWGITCLIAIAQIPSMTNKDGGVKTLAMRFFLLLTIGLIITAIAPISKLHLLWWIPVSYLGNAFVFNYLVSKSLKPLLDKISMPQFGNQVSWNIAYKNVFKIVDFDRNGSVINEKGVVIAKSSFQPYGYLIVESPVLAESTRLPIIHRDDFLLASSIYGDEKLKEVIQDLEFLVTYYPKAITSKGLSLSPFHVLHFVIANQSTLQNIYFRGTNAVDDEKLKSLFKHFVWEGNVRVEMNL